MEPTSAEDQAELIKLYLSQGIDEESGKPSIFNRFKPQVGEGFGELGSIFERLTRPDLFSNEVEKLLSPEELNQLAEYYGQTEISIPKEDDPGFLSTLKTRFLGRDPTSVDVKVEEAARRRGGGAEGFNRLLREVFGQTPTEREIEGRPPEGVDVNELNPAQRILLNKFPYDPVTPRVIEKIDSNEYGISPIPQGQRKDFAKVTKRGRKALRIYSQLPGDLGKNGAADLVSNILASDFNARYNTEVTPESLDIRLQKTADGMRLTFEHPDPDIGRVKLDPANFDWGDVLDTAPDLAIILSDVFGSIAGGTLGMRGGPVAGFAGMTAGGAVGSAAAKWLLINRALKEGKYVYDSSRGGYVSNETGREHVIPLTGIINDVAIEFGLSAGGSVVGGFVGKILSTIFSKGARTRDIVSPEVWEDAWNTWGKSKFGKDFESTEAKPTPSVVLNNQATKLAEKAEALPVGPARTKLLKQATIAKASAEGFDNLEKRSVAATSQVEQARQGIAAKTRVTPEGETLSEVTRPDPENFGFLVQKALREGDGKRINSLLDQIRKRNEETIGQFNKLFEGVPSAKQTEVGFGRDIRNKANEVLGLVNGQKANETSTGIYGEFNLIRKAAKRYPTKQIFDLSKPQKIVEKEINKLKKIGGGAYPSEIQSFFLKLQKGDFTNVTYDQLGKLQDLLDLAMKDGELPKNMFQRVQELKDLVDNVEIKGLNAIDPNLGNRYKTAKEQYENFKSIWQKNFNQQITELNSDKIANKFLQISDERTVNSILNDLGKLGIYGKQQENLLRNVLKSRLKNILLRQTGKSDTVQVGAQRIDLPIAGKLPVKTLDEATLDQFKTDHEVWIKRLFPDDTELDKYAELVTSASNMRKRTERIGRIDRELKNLPFLQGQKLDGTDLANLALTSPNQLFDLAWQTGRPGVENARNVKKLNDILKRGLSPEDYGIAQESLKKLALQRVWKADETIGAAESAGEAIIVSDITDKSVKSLNRDKDAFVEIFGNEHYKNLIQLFRAMDTLTNPDRPFRGVSEAASKIDERTKGTVAQIPLIFAKVYVGVLNQKARALNLGKKFVDDRALNNFERVLSDANALNRAIKIRDTKLRRLAPVLGSAIAVSENEAQNLIDNYTIIEGNQRVPAPVQTKEEAQREALGIR